MGHIVSRQPWGVIDIDTTLGRVFLRQDWHYTWKLYTAGLRPWTYEQKRKFHNTIDRQIWGIWSNRVRLKVSGNADFCKHVAASGVPINFDIRWVTGVGHWSVGVRKMPAGSGRTTFRSYVDFAGRKIELDTMDVVPSGAANAAGGSTARFLAVPHEFGHALQAPDEYNAGNPNLTDTNSIMNVGRQIRPRHLQQIVATLNTMIPGVTFTAPTTIP
jgi:hypothetical protein